MISLLVMKMLKLFGGNLIRGCNCTVSENSSKSGDGDGCDCDDSGDDYHES